MSEAIADAKKQFLCENLSFAAKEAYKKLRTNTLLVLPNDDACKVIGITSAQPSEGKSLTAINIAYTFSELGKRVLLVDADLRRPSINVKLGKTQSPGFSNLLTDTNAVGSVIQKYVSSDGVEHFDIIAGGNEPENPSELLSSARLKMLIEALRKVYDYVLLDLPPVGAVIDAVAVGKQTDGMIVVLRENNCPKKAFTSCVSQLEFAKINILGFVMNGSLEGVGKKYQYSGSYYYK